MIASPIQHAEWLDFRYLIFRFSVFIAINAMLANLLPNAKCFAKRPSVQCWYEVLVCLIAIFSLNWRACLPSLDAEFLGFKARSEDMPVPMLRERLRKRRMLRRVMR